MGVAIIILLILVFIGRFLYLLVDRGIKTSSFKRGTAAFERDLQLAKVSMEGKFEPKVFCSRRFTGFAFDLDTQLVFIRGMFGLGGKTRSLHCKWTVVHANKILKWNSSSTRGRDGEVYWINVVVDDIEIPNYQVAFIHDQDMQRKAMALLDRLVNQSTAITHPQVKLSVQSGNSFVSNDLVES